MRNFIDRILGYRPDLLIVLIVLGVILALIFPADGTFADVMDWVVKIVIGVLFFLYGARLSTREALNGLMHWRLHLLILAFTFLLFPLIGLALMPLQHAIGEDLYQGILFLCLVPSTVQSSVNFTSIAKGNVPGAIISASASNLIGVFVTPVLVLLLMSSAGGGLTIDTSVFLDIALQLLAPFIVGQIARAVVPAVQTFAKAKPTSYVDKISIGLVVYVAFSEGIVMGVWSSVSWVAIVGIIIGSVVLVWIMLTVTSWVARKLGFNYADQVAIQFCGTKKSLASGLPMATVMFSGGAGLIIVPLMIFHQVQLMMCSVRAAKYEATRPENTW
ncbi:bile acid:sodium symporter family protein [Corynebacterium variabile]|uniref:Secondary Na+/bile acid symporter, bile acid:Na+ symporter family protein n=2 Tax=Corynebacterium variabile TaxID=1727 RepID=A0A4Y4C2K8_9CORY|nr:bile acid:sodium symporter family protein [Corynebacterium variabile]MDN6241953.1 bile acid:sodium symporter [Corynebacterium variabile]MDN6476613.1 bile acid:sodium symporter [Corynebacterium variabile]MDN6536210.1 bile acid:sodium symporter [Corynebacterium variabile]MDN6661190.1 bile acid:sodium symporter [Corynebacterium variabile]MDN6675391.1 bile acid:sodium symporter [Corynebacterium variabile]